MANNNILTVEPFNNCLYAQYYMANLRGDCYMIEYEGKFHVLEGEPPKTLRKGERLAYKIVNDVLIKC